MAVLRFVDAIPSSSWHQLPFSPETRVRRHDIEVFRYDRLPWEPIDSDAILSGEYAPTSDASYGVRVGVYCWWDEEPSVGGSRTESRVLWYVVAGGRLRSWDHFDFDPTQGCAPRASFHRGDDVDLDFVIDLRRDPGLIEHRRTCPSVEAYGRALAYVDARRTQEARALLAFGDRTVELDARGDVVRAATGLACIEPARALRRRLRQRLPVWTRGGLSAPPSSP